MGSSVIHTMASTARGVAALVLVSMLFMVASAQKKYPNSSGEGITTRFWDCCKVTCAWRNNAGPVSAPVQTCSAGGVSRVGENEQSSCNGGNAFICNKQQPFVKNNKAYAFVAANVNGLPTSALCCACYSLKFKDTAIKGKVLTVQVINTGSDLKNNHFDIAIPGGGMGIFTQGCPKQWPGTPPQNWGKQYGGVSTKAQAAGLPKALQPGASDFRFGWFKNADNPHVHFQRVKCPKVLINRSGCKRNDD